MWGLECRGSSGFGGFKVRVSGFRGFDSHTRTRQARLNRQVSNTSALGV